MTIQYCSDLHLEFRENEEFLIDNPLKPVAKVLVLAGDIVPFNQMKKHAAFFDFISDNFEVCYWIAGNHEYYHFDLSTKSGVIEEKIRSNVFLVNDRVIYRENTKLVLSTLWTLIDDDKMVTIQSRMSDFRLIRNGENIFTPTDSNRLHTNSMDFLKNALKDKENGKTVVITHHVPTFLNYPLKYRGDALNQGFATELKDFIRSSNIDYWIYGHHHQFIPEFKIGRTTLLTNQLGYVKYDEHLNFNPGISIDMQETT